MKYELERINCSFCGSSRYDIYIKGAKEFYNGTGEKFDVVKCLDCDFVFTNPRPTKDTIGYFYPDSAGYYQPAAENITGISPFQKKILETILKHCYHYDIETSYGNFIAHLLKLFLSKKTILLQTPDFVKGGRLLDIGCSWGGYLSRMQSYGWDVYGTEINEKAVKYACEQLCLENVRCGFFEDVFWESNFFDAVNMSMVLEHLYDPLKTLHQVNTIMKPKGKLMFSVPDISGFEARLYKDRFYGLHVPQHLSHFSPETIKKFLQKSGFAVEKIVHHRFDRDMVASAGYLYNKLLYKFLSNRAVRKTFVRIFIESLSMLNKTSRMTVFARKSDG